MPPKRRSTGRTTSTPNTIQSTLTFHGRPTKVTKPSSTAAGKDLLSKKSSKTSLRSESSKPSPVTQGAEAELSRPVTPTPLTTSPSPTLAPTTLETAIQERSAQEALSPPTDEETAARKLSEARIKKYWGAKEEARLAPRIHQKELSLYEKILREFDVTGKYGPCIGIPRITRWKRAHRLRLNPPLEVLAVLLREQDSQNVAVQRSHIDEGMSVRAADPEAA